MALTLLFGWAWYQRYWRWRDCFNELGRCWDSEGEQVLLEQAGLVWGGAAVLFLTIAMALLWKVWRRG